MNNLLIFILNVIIQTFLCSYAIYSISKFFNSEGYSKKQTTLLTVTMLICNIISLTIKSYVMFLNILFSITTIIFTSHYILKFKWSKSILISVLSMAYTAITEILVMFTGIAILKLEAIELSSKPIILIILSFLQSIVSFLALNLLHFIADKKISIKHTFESITFKQTIVFTISLILCIFPQMILFVLTDYSYPPEFLIINSLQFVLICVFLFVYIKKSVEHDKTQSDLFTSELHNKTLVGMVDGVRTLKHDYNNIMQALNGYVSTKQYDKLQNHINGVLEECNIVNSLAVIDPKIFNDPAIYGIVGSKFFLANEQNLPFEFDIVTNIAEIQFPMPDLSRILGILLDNAMEATKKAKKPLIRLEMKFDKRKCADVIRVINTYDTSIEIDLESIYKKGFSTKKIKSGIGLWEVKKLVSKVRNAQVYPTIENDKFVQNLIIEKLD